MTDIAPPRSPAEKAAAQARLAADRTRRWRDRVKVRAMADWAIVTALLDLQAEQPPMAASDPGRPITLRDVTHRGKANLVAAGFKPVDAVKAIGMRIEPRGPRAPAPVTSGPA